MATMSPVVNDRSRTFTQYVLLVAISVAATALFCTQSVLAQTDGGFTPGMSIEHYGSPMASDPGGSWNTIPPSLADPALAPAPEEPVEPPLPQMHVQLMPWLAGGFIQPSDDPAIPATRPMLVSPPISMGRPLGLFPPLR